MLPSMQPKLFYRARQAGHDVFIEGHFYNGRFYHRQHLSARSRQTARFFISKGKTIGQPTPPEHIAGHVVGLVLILNDGTLLNLVEVDRQSLERS